MTKRRWFADFEFAKPLWKEYVELKGKASFISGVEEKSFDKQIMFHVKHSIFLYI